jgi:hypothetical protein
MDTRPNGPSDDIDIALSTANGDREVSTAPTGERVVTSGLPLQVEKKRSKKPLIFTLIVLLLLAAGGGGYYYFVMNKPAETPTQVVKSSPKPTLTPAEDLVSKIKPQLKASLVDVPKSDSGFGELADGTVVYGVASYQPGDTKFATEPKKQFGVATSSTGADHATVDTDYDAIVGYLKAHDFTSNNPTPDAKLPKHVFYMSDKIVCSIDEVYDIKGSSYVGVGCADVSSYEAVAKVAQPFYDAYIVANPQLAKASTTPVFIGNPTIKDGSGKDYKNAQVQLSSGKGFFYQEPGKDWKFFMDAQSVLACTKFNTDVLMKAFSGTACLDAAGKQSTVKVTAATVSPSPTVSSSPTVTPKP